MAGTPPELHPPPMSHRGWLGTSRSASLRTRMAIRVCLRTKGDLAQVVANKPFRTRSWIIRSSMTFLGDTADPQRPPERNDRTQPVEPSTTTSEIAILSTAPCCQAVGGERQRHHRQDGSQSSASQRASVIGTPVRIGHSQTKLATTRPT